MKVKMPAGDYTGEAVISAFEAVLRRYYPVGDDRWEFERFPAVGEFRLSGDEGGKARYVGYVGLRAGLYTRIWDGPRGLPRTMWVPKESLIDGTGAMAAMKLTLVPISTADFCREFELVYSHAELYPGEGIAKGSEKGLTTLLERFLHQLYETHKVGVA